MGLLQVITYWLIKLLPQHGISRIVYKLTRIEQKKWVPKAAQYYAKHFNIDMSEALHPDFSYYSNFNAFFTRELKENARPIANSPWVSPVDGTVSAYGLVKNDRLIQAKGIDYSLDQLCAGDKGLADHFRTGSFITIYLSPADYHRIHMPCDGKLLEQYYVPGSLHSVNQYTVNTLPGVFAKNERVLALFDTEFGKMAMILVGAINVSAIDTVWHGAVTPDPLKMIAHTLYDEEPVNLNQGEEMGRFNMGSTVILLSQAPVKGWKEPVKSGNKIRLGQPVV